MKQSWIKRDVIRRQRYNKKGDGWKPRNYGFTIHPELLIAVERDAQKFNCTASFVINTAIALAMSIDVGEKYYMPPDDVKSNGHKKNGRR